MPKELSEEALAKWRHLGPRLRGDKLQHGIAAFAGMTIGSMVLFA